MRHPALLDRERCLLILIDFQEGYRNALLVKRSDLLKLAILINLKTTAAEIGHEIVLLIDDGGVENHLLNLLPENELPWISLNRRVTALA